MMLEDKSGDGDEIAVQSINVMLEDKSGNGDEIAVQIESCNSSSSYCESLEANKSSLVGSGAS